MAPLAEIGAIITITIITEAITIMPGERGRASFPWLYRTLSWMSPAWPIGAFAFSSGLEWAHEAGWLRDGAAVQNWLEESLREGQLRADCGAFVHGWQAMSAPDPGRTLAGLAEIVMAAQGSAERALEASAQGGAFKRIALAANSEIHPDQCAAYATALENIADTELPYAIAASAFFAAFEIPLEPAITAFLHAAVSNLVSAAQRIVPLGHTEAQVLLVRLEPDIDRARSHALATASLPIEACLASGALAADIAAMRHETQYTRLFRT